MAKGLCFREITQTVAWSEKPGNRYASRNDEDARGERHSKAAEADKEKRHTENPTKMHWENGT